MHQQARIRDVYGPGTFTDREFLPVPDEAARIFRLLASQTPGFTKDPSLLAKVQFTGEEYPVIPGPLKSVPISAALQAMAGVVAEEILTLRSAAGQPNHANRQQSRKIQVNTTHTALWLSTASAVHLGGEALIDLFFNRTLNSLIPDWQKGSLRTAIDLRGTGVYPTNRPERWYLLHGSLNIPAMLRNLGIDPDRPEIKTPEQAYEYISGHTVLRSPEELEYENLVSGFCGSICFTPAEWASTTMSRALSQKPLIDVSAQPSHSIPLAPVPFLPLPGGRGKPLEGIRVLSLERIIAAPQLSCLLASYGAEVIRVNAPHLPDMNMLQLSLNAGKKTVALDLRDPNDKAKLHDLLREADVFVQGFRPTTLNKFGLSRDDVLAVAAERGKGIVYVAESCYGSEGVYASRPGWQQVADCATGAAHVMGRAYGLKGGECVLPSLPISDMMCGAVGAVGVLMALRDRATKGGSYTVRPVLVKGNMVALSEEVGLYQPEVVKECQARFGWREMRGEHHVLDLLKIVWDGWIGNEVMKGYLDEENKEIWKTWDKSDFGPSGSDGMRLSILRPVVRFLVKKGGGGGGDGDGGEKESLENGVTPEWTLPSVPYGFHDKNEVSFQPAEEKAGSFVQGLWSQLWNVYQAFMK